LKSKKTTVFFFLKSKKILIFPYFIVNIFNTIFNNPEKVELLE